MDIKNVDKVEKLISERKSIIEFREEIESIVKSKERISINGFEFQPHFKAFYSEKFLMDIKEKMIKECDTYVVKINKELAEL